MKERRNASQILFGFLPEQTVDLNSGVWKVKRWRHPPRESNIDTTTLRRELIRLAMPWQRAGMDGGMVQGLSANTDVEVLSLDRQNGVEVERFPDVWICKRCGRVKDYKFGRCDCGYTGQPGQLYFVGFHPECGDIRAPYIPRCKTHNDVKIQWSASAAASDIKFVCPVCDQLLRKGFGNPPCHCGRGHLRFNVHRANSVYLPHTVVLVNPPSREKIRRIVEAGGPARALTWVLEGMKSRNMEDVAATESDLRQRLLDSGMDEETVSRMLETARQDGKFPDQGEVELPPFAREEAESQAKTVALATSESRVTFQDLIEGAASDSGLVRLYRDHYPDVLEKAGLEAVDFIDSFPVLTGHFGYTRGKHTPDESRLVPFRAHGRYQVFGEVAQTEALFIRLDPLKVANWLKGEGVSLPKANNSTDARRAILETVGEDVPSDGDQAVPNRPAEILQLLVHSYAHRFIRLAAVHGGIDRNALAELLVPWHCGFFVYAAARGDFVLGGLQALFESELDQLLSAMVNDEHRCPLDPGCIEAGGACVACLHLGEPSCRHFNKNLSRMALSGPNGYLAH